MDENRILKFPVSHWVKPENVKPKLGETGNYPFTDIINESNIIKYYFNIYISNKTEVSKNILISFIQVFNFASDKKTPRDMLIQLLLCYDSSFKQLSDNKRKTRNELETIYNSIN